MTRCPWAGTDPLYVTYHDKEWGIPVYDDQILFEFLVLESAQAGLSWITILKRREAYRSAYGGFDVQLVSEFTDTTVNQLLENSGIVKHRKKIESSIENAKHFLEIQKEFGSFSHYLWAFVDHTPMINTFQTMSHVPTATPISDALSKDLKKRGFKFIGTTIMYAYMEAVGMVCDHVITCPSHPYNQ